MIKINLTKEEIKYIDTLVSLSNEDESLSLMFDASEVMQSDDTIDKVKNRFKISSSILKKLRGWENMKIASGEYKFERSKFPSFINLVFIDNEGNKELIANLHDNRVTIHIDKYLNNKKFVVLDEKQKFTELN